MLEPGVNRTQQYGYVLHQILGTNIICDVLDIFILVLSVFHCLPFFVGDPAYFARETTSGLCGCRQGSQATVR